MSPASNQFRFQSRLWLLCLCSFVSARPLYSRSICDVYWLPYYPSRVFQFSSCLSPLPMSTPNSTSTTHCSLHQCPNVDCQRRRCDFPVSTCEMAESELNFSDVAKLTAAIFSTSEELWGDEGSPWRKFYAAVSNQENRIIAWNTNKCVIFSTVYVSLRRYRLTRRDSSRAFDPHNIFFRSVDTGRWLSMENAPFSLQLYKTRANPKLQDGKFDVLMGSQMVKYSGDCVSYPLTLSSYTSDS